MTRNSTKLTTTTTLSAMLMAALFFCSDPVDPLAMMARMKAGITQMRQKSDVPQQTSVMMENTRAHDAKASLPFAGGGTYEVLAVVG